MRPFLVMLLAALLLGSGALAGEVPTLSGEYDYVHDYAGLLDDETEELAQALAEESFREAGTPLVVVTIQNLRDYDYQDIEHLAYRWFGQWKIGALGLEDGSNRGILLLVSVGDRKARIELGEDWGRRWDRHCERIMSWDLVPAFKGGDYAGGVRVGVQALLEMARIGPQGRPPQSGLRVAFKFLGDYSMFPPTAALCFLALGFGLLLHGALRPAKNGLMFALGGMALIMVGAFTYLTLVLVGLAFMPSGSRHRRFSSGSGGGGGFSGSSSGGSSSSGGATGSW